MGLFITCFNDALFPGTGKALVTLLERLGHEVTFEPAQTCCGQLHWTTGYHREAAGLARRFADLCERLLSENDLLVTPSASCAAMVAGRLGRGARHAGEDPARLSLSPRRRRRRDPGRRGDRMRGGDRPDRHHRAGPRAGPGPADAHLGPRLPPVRVHADQIVGSVPEAVERLDPYRPLTWISGPSVPGQMELSRVEGGVHGPRVLDVLVVDEAAPVRAG